MSEIFKIAAKGYPIRFPHPLFENSVVYYEILMWENGKCIEVLLLKSEQSSFKKFLLIGGSSRDGNLFAINKISAIKALNLIVNRLTYNIGNKEEIQIDEIKQAITNLNNIRDDDLEKEDKLLHITDNIFVLINAEKNEGYNIKLRICSSNGTIINPTIFNFVGFSGSDDYGELIIENIEKEELKFLHLINEFQISVGYGEEMNIEYSGLILKVKRVSESSIMMIFSSTVYNLKNSRIGFVISKNINPLHVIDLLVRNHGWKANIEGLKETVHPYIVLIPIRNLVLETESIGIGNVELISNTSNNNDVVQMKELVKEKWQGETIAKVNVDGKSIYESYLIAKRQIEDALNVINHLVKQDSIYELYSAEKYLTEWDRDAYVPRPSLTSLMYIRNLVTNGIIVADMENIYEPNSLRLGKDFNEKLEKLEWYEELVASNMDNEADKSVINLFNALKWLKRSWDAVNLEDQIIFSNISIEFLLSEEKVPPLLKKGLRKKIISAAINEFNSEFEGSEEEKEKLANDIKQKFSLTLTNAPLFAKLDKLINDLDIPVNSTDREYLNKIRKKRNDLVHGRVTENIEQIDLWKANTIIGMIIAYKMKYRGRNK